MQKEHLKQGARKLVEVNGRVTAADKLVVITDYTMLSIAEYIIEAARATGAEVVTCIMPIRQRDGQEPPTAVAAAMKEATVLFSPVRYSITHTRAMRAALDSGTRAIIMTAYTEDLLESPALLETDFVAQADVCRRIGAAFSSGDRVKLTSPRGTDLTFSIEGRTANVLTNIPEPGQLAPVPGIEVNVVPITGSAQGRLVADASVPYLGIGVLDEPITCQIEDGYITNMEGGEQAQILKADLNSQNDRNCFNVAELGVGLNPNARLNGTMLDDEGVMGTIHIGIGTSHTLGGDVVAATHYDLLMWSPEIEVDGVVIQRDQEILI